MRSLLTTLLVLVLFAAGGYFAFRALRPSRPPMTAAEQLMADNLYRPHELYHVEDLQARPAVAAALTRLRAADVCDLIYLLDVTRMNSDPQRARLCGPVTDDVHVKQEREYNYHSDQLHPYTPKPQGFAVLTDASGVMYLIAAGRYGSRTAEQMEKEIVTVIDNAIKLLPQFIAGKQKHEAEQEQAREADAAARQRAKESFK